jgi:hypothetical protein
VFCAFYDKESLPGQPTDDFLGNFGFDVYSGICEVRDRMWGVWDYATTAESRVDEETRGVGVRWNGICKIGLEDAELESVPYNDGFEGVRLHWEHRNQDRQANGPVKVSPKVRGNGPLERVNVVMDQETGCI